LRYLIIMEFRIAADELKKALHRAQGIVEKKSTMPILSNVLLSASKGSLSMTAFDLDIGVVSEHPADVSKPGAVTVSAKTLADITAFLPEANVSLKKLPNNYVEITSGAAHYKIVGMAPEEFPKLPKPESQNFVKVSGQTLIEMVKKTQFAISHEEMRFTLNGVFFEPKEGGKVRMVATDGHRLALCEKDLVGDFKLKGGVIIPRKGLFELKRLLDEAPDAECELGFAENSAVFRKVGLSMVMRLIDGQFPEYQRVIPKDSEKQVLLHRQRFTDSLKRMALLSPEKSNAVAMALSENLLRVSVNNPEQGEAKDDLEVAYRGAALSVGFNARYILDVLSVLDSDEVSLGLGDEHAPGVFHAPGDKSFLAIVMPMRP
jgi:DNA polymerase III subunit beta